MNIALQGIILDALDIKEASIKRGINTTKNPRFKEVYNEELRDLQRARTAFNDYCNTWNQEEKKK